MGYSETPDSVLRFERRFQLNPRTGELWKDGIRLKIQDQPLKVLTVLLLHSGQIVTREELRQLIRPEEEFGDFDVSLNKAITKLRSALGDSAEVPHLIETLPRRGYRFIGTVDSCPYTDAPSVAQRTWSERVITRLRSPKSVLALLLVTVAAVADIGYAPFARIARYYNNQGVVHQQKGELQEAIRDYQWALRLKLNYAEAHYNLADVYEEIPNYSQALEQYQRAIDIDPTFYPAYNNLSRLYILRQKQYGAAMRLLDRAFSFQPKEPAVQYTLHKNYGWANFELGQLGQAEQNLRIAVGLDAQRGSAHCLLAKVLDGQGRAAEGLPEWVSCLGYSNQPEVEPEWRNEAQEKLRTHERLTGG